MFPRDRERSAKRPCMEISILKLPDATLRMQDLPEEAAFHLPLDIHYDPHNPRVLMLIAPPPLTVSQS